MLGLIAIFAVAVVAWSNTARFEESSLTMEEKITRDVKRILGDDAKVMLHYGSGQVYRVIAVVPAGSIWDVNSFVKSGSMDSWLVFSKIFGQDEYSSVSSIKVEHWASFTDMFGASNERVAYSYDMSRATAELIQDWDEIRYLAWDNPFSWYREIMSIGNGDDMFVNPTISRDFYSGN
jgi:hypothetical protein